MALKDQEDTWGLAAVEAASFFAGVAAGFWLCATLAWTGIAIAAGAAAVGWNRRFRMLAAGLAIGVGLLLLAAAMYDFARPDF